MPVEGGDVTVLFDEGDFPEITNSVDGFQPRFIVVVPTVPEPSGLIPGFAILAAATRHRKFG